eukprot:6201388-Pleurochrysis_carterae.AAC.3
MSLHGRVAARQHGAVVLALERKGEREREREGGRSTKGAEQSPVENATKRQKIDTGKTRESAAAVRCKAE